MNFSNPILICDEIEEFRILIRDMLTRNGFFHVLEASNAKEASVFLSQKSEYLVLVDAKAMTPELEQLLKKQKAFILFAESSDYVAAKYGVLLGVDHIMSYPVHSRKLIDRINSLL